VKSDFRQRLRHDVSPPNKSSKIPTIERRNIVRGTQWLSCEIHVRPCHAYVTPLLGGMDGDSPNVPRALP
jgi:hypothetical protein